MLTRFYADNFRCLVDFTYEPGQLGLMVGRSGSGKSSVPDALETVVQMLHSSERFGVCDSLPPYYRTLWHDSDSQTFALHVTYRGHQYDYRVNFTYNTPDSEARVATEELVRDGELAFSFAEGVGRLHKDNQIVREYKGDGTSLVLLKALDKDNDERVQAFVDWWNHALWNVKVGHEDVLGHSDHECESPEAMMSDFASWYRYCARTNSDDVAELNRELDAALDRVAQLQMVAQAPEPDGWGNPKSRSLVALIRNPRKPDDLRPCPFGSLSFGERALIQLYALAYLGLQPDRTLCIEIRASLEASALRRWLHVLLRRAEKSSAQVLVEINDPEILGDFPTHVVKRFE